MGAEIGLGLVVLALVAWIGWAWWQARRAVAELNRELSRTIASTRCPGLGVWHHWQSRLYCDWCKEDDRG